MSAELIVVNGPQAGARHSLVKGDIVIGRSPDLQIVLPEPEVGWRHSQVRQQGGRFMVVDLRSSAGTYVNGMRSAERWLEDRDQIGIGKTILMFRADASVDEAAGGSAEAKPVLLAACSLVFLFRALAAGAGSWQPAPQKPDPRMPVPQPPTGGQNMLLQTQILRLIGDLMPVASGYILLGNSCGELVAQYEARVSAGEQRFHAAIEKICDEGAYADEGTQIVAVPLYLEGALGGALLVEVPSNEKQRLTNHLETLTAIATLASVGFEANREVETLKAENALLQEQIAANTGIVGTSAVIRRLLELVERVGPRDTTVLITGESGTGKELIARALHQKSARKDFVAVNCAALSESLFESELFGHEKGAFTGAISLKRGRFEMAQGGTIFLDEVGELAVGLQAKLLRVLQQREFERVGGTQAHALDIRVIAATNRNLHDEVKEGRFREDLYHRLNVVSLESPPLRERKDDIPLLAQFFLQRSAERCKRQMRGLSEDAAAIIVQYAWPGNVRELENAMERAVVLGVSEWVLPEDLPESLLESAPREMGAKYHDHVGQAKREAILDAYRQGAGDYKQAAKLLNLHPNYLLRLVRNMNLRDEINRLDR